MPTFAVYTVREDGRERLHTKYTGTLGHCTKYAQELLEGLVVDRIHIRDILGGLRVEVTSQRVSTTPEGHR